MQAIYLQCLWTVLHFSSTQQNKNKGSKAVVFFTELNSQSEGETTKKTKTQNKATNDGSGLLWLIEVIVDYVHIFPSARSSSWKMDKIDFLW